MTGVKRVAVVVGIAVAVALTFAPASEGNAMTRGLLRGSQSVVDGVKRAAVGTSRAVIGLFNRGHDGATATDDVRRQSRDGSDQEADFVWRGEVEIGQTLQIKGVNGDIIAERAAGEEIQVRAEKRSRPRGMGHQAGLKALRRIVEHCGRLGVAELTIFAFSSENWNRPHQEVNRLMDLFMRALDKEARELHENGVRLRFIGELSAFSAAMQNSIQQTVDHSSENRGMTLNVAVNYGGRWDVMQAARALAQACEDGKMCAKDIDESSLASRMMLADSPPPDLFIRTGGEMRISNFLLWESAYSEFYFSPVLWPDFSPKCLDDAIAEFTSRERRFGLTGSQVRRQAG